MFPRPSFDIAIAAVALAAIAGCSRPPPPQESSDAMRDAVQQLEQARAELAEATEELRTVTALLRELTEPELAAPPYPPPAPSAGSHDELGELLDQGIERVGERSYEVDRDALDAVLANPAAVARGARIVPSIRDGRANGFKLYAIRPSSVFARLGLMNGDTVTTVNGRQLTTPDEALDVYADVRGADRLVLRVMRRGSPIELTYAIRGN